jgi:hypothetical protein
MSLEIGSFSNVQGSDSTVNGLFDLCLCVSGHNSEFVSIAKRLSRRIVAFENSPLATSAIKK